MKSVYAVLGVIIAVLLLVNIISDIKVGGLKEKNKDLKDKVSQLQKKNAELETKLINAQKGVQP
ncbi:hypothetical protein [Bacillus sp. H1a]|uniref:hypothetical protein n=1 Tax=Bacillus sp. H1a TaxID=1397276 RepID=UPI000469AEEE|nr:hypothetical protein [Bacillus sp. H1a]